MSGKSKGKSDKSSGNNSSWASDDKYSGKDKDKDKKSSKDHDDDRHDGKKKPGSNKDDDHDGDHKGSTKDHVAGQTGAAKDESLTLANASNLTLDVLANDPGSARLWSIDQDALAGPGCAQVPEDLATITLASGATLSVNPDGTLNYQPPAGIANLPLGAIFTDSFSYVIRMANGALSTAQTCLTINGTSAVNTPAIFSGVDSGNVVEDGMLTANGTLQVNDADAGQSAFAATGDLQGNYGIFSFNLGTGAWTYQLDNANAAVQGLNDGETLEDTLVISSVDGSSTALTITIDGDDEAAVDPSLLWVLNNLTNEVVRNDNGETALIAFSGNDGLAILTNFTANDVLNHNGIDFDGSYLSDVDGDGQLDDTVASFSYVQDGEFHTVEVGMVDFVGFDSSVNLTTGIIPV